MTQSLQHREARIYCTGACTWALYLQRIPPIAVSCSCAANSWMGKLGGEMGSAPLDLCNSGLRTRQDDRLNRCPGNVPFLNTLGDRFD